MHNHSCNDIRYIVITDLGSVNFKALYELYDSIFTLPEEKESLEGFEKSMQLSSDRSLLMEYGPFQELWISVEDSQGNVIGGANFSIFSIRKYRVATIHITYLFSDKECRNTGIGTSLIDEIESVSAKWVESTGLDIERLDMFCEQNAPELMTLEEYVQDSTNAGIDQCDRLVWWHKRGFRRLMMNYVQPPLDSDSTQCRNMTLNVKTAKRSFPASIVYEHLLRFFRISVLKNKTNLNTLSDEILLQMPRERSIRTCGSVKYYRMLKKRMLLADIHPLQSIYPHER